MSSGILQSMMNAWQFIFNYHPESDKIVHTILETPEVVNSTLFEKWYHEAERHAFV